MKAEESALRIWHRSVEKLRYFRVVQAKRKLNRGIENKDCVTKNSYFDVNARDYQTGPAWVSGRLSKREVSSAVAS